jgi:hypothetical protein
VEKGSFQPVLGLGRRLSYPGPTQHWGRRGAGAEDLVRKHSSFHPTCEGTKISATATPGGWRCPMSLEPAQACRWRLAGVPVASYILLWTHWHPLNWNLSWHYFLGQSGCEINPQIKPEWAKCVTKNGSGCLALGPVGGRALFYVAALCC